MVKSRLLLLYNSHSNNAEFHQRIFVFFSSFLGVLHAIMDSLANYGSDGENSNNSDDTKMPCSGGTQSLERRASDANYDPVQMDMSEESNNNNSSGDSGSERAASPAHDRHATGSRRDSSRHRSSPADQRRSDYDSHSSNSRDDHKRTERQERGRNSRERSKSRRSAHDDRRHRENEHSRDLRDSKRSSRDNEKKSSRDDERRRDRKSSSSCRDDRNEERDKDHHHHHRDDRRDRDRSDRDYRRDRNRRHSRDDRTKERHRDERSNRENKEKARTRSRSRSKERAPPQSFRTMSYREEKGRNKLAQLEKLGIELKAPGDPIIPAIIGEPNYYNPLATSTAGKYAEQIQKRKLLWANKSKQEEGKSLAATASTASTWIGTTFTHDQDGKVTAKFKRLMGIKADMPVAPQPANKPDILKKQEEMFNNMEQQYEVARATTHTQRGVGLGYATGGYQFPR